jgi:hypothetical protein
MMFLPFRFKLSWLIMREGKKSQGGIRDECGGVHEPSRCEQKLPGSKNGISYKRQAAIAANSNLGLVGVDKDPGMAFRTTTTVAGNNSLVSPCDWLLVDHLNSSLRLRLSHS